jgi:lipopolysaccharide export LptBFGC system permease protein LptF
MKKLIAFLPLIALLLNACSDGADGGKKLVVISSGKFTTDKYTIAFEPGNQHNEQELIFKEKEKITILVKSADGEKSYDLPEDGTWLLNLKKDTVVGGLVNYGDKGTPGSISAEELNRIIDSTKQLMVGENTSFEKKNFNIPPNTIKKISNDIRAIILSPYKLIPSKIELDKDGKAPEYYKFFTNSQKREALDEMLKRLTK